MSPNNEDGRGKLQPHASEQTLERRSPQKSLWESIQPHAQTLFGAATCPVQNDVMNVHRHLDVSSPNNEDGRGKLPPHASEQTLRRRSPTKSDSLWESKQPHAGTLFGTATCPVQKDVMKASSSMQTAVEAGAWTGESTSTTD